MDRISKDAYFMGVAHIVSLRSTCVRRRVGCVLVDRFNHIMATGHNGVPRNVAHCIDDPCRGANLPSGEGLDKCIAVHAEANALLQCRDIMQIEKAYCTSKPCIHCMKMFMNTAVQQVVYDEDYPGELEIQPAFTLRQYRYANKIDMERAQELAVLRRM